LKYILIVQFPAVPVLNPLPLISKVVCAAFGVIVLALINTAPLNVFVVLPVTATP